MMPDPLGFARSRAADFDREIRMTAIADASRPERVPRRGLLAWTRARTVGKTTALEPRSGVP